MSQRLPDPPLVPSSMQSGGQLPGSKFLAEMGPPGSDTVTGPPAPEQVTPQRLPQPMPSNPEQIGVDASPGDRPRVPGGHPSGKGGQFTTARDPDTGMWRLTPSARS